MIVKDTKPSNAISILNADVIVDFDAPEDYEEPTPVPPAPQQAKYNPEEDHHTEDPLRVESYSSLEEESSEEDTTNLFIGKAESVGGKKIADKTTVLGMMGTKKQEDAKVLVMEGGKILYKSPEEVTKPNNTQEDNTLSEIQKARNERLKKEEEAKNNREQLFGKGHRLR
eukprot:TRINITY_DN1732_c0_g1_i1.p1 TRINITY_DN1732_c0_g1~~TRINITY_DN1732_c0_g1_i1.p1  ORF type:complete len:170 (+),score=56.28 TRINITY_DN1732_c0_g1_i1:578-1087(+)